MKRNLWGWGLALGVAALVVGRQLMPSLSEPVFDAKTVERNVKAATIAAQAQNEFGLKLLRVVAKGQPQKNTFISPTSVWMALSMAKNGAGGTTKTELQQVLELQNDDSAPTIALSAVLKAQGAKINLANAIWASKTTPFSPTFIKNSAQTFGASAQSLDFTAPASIDVINKWVEEQTEGKITGLVKELPASGAVLTNALYFRGRWQTPFEKKYTEDAPFLLPDGKTKNVPMMSADYLASISDKTFEGAILPYANSSCELWALLPANGQSPLAVLASLSAAKLAAIKPKGEIKVQFPRCSLGYEDSLASPLKTLGLKAIFNQKTADLRPMGLPMLLSHLSEARHKTRLEIDEQGTVAEAATDLGFNAASASVGVNEVLTFDRPFVLLLRENRSGALLFAGIVNDPQTTP